MEDIRNDFDSVHLKSFDKSTEIIENNDSYEKLNVVSSGTCIKRSRQDYTDTDKEFHKKVILKDVFDPPILPVLNSLLKLDPQGLPSAVSTEFPTYGEHEIKELYNHYGTRKEDTLQERTITIDALLDVPIDALLIGYAGFKNYVAQQKLALSEE